MEERGIENCRRRRRKKASKCKCGMGLQGADPTMADHNDRFSTFKRGGSLKHQKIEGSLKPHNRIVNGYVPKWRAWMVHFLIVQGRGETLRKGRCGGSIINKRWILSAGHCFCDTLPCQKDKKGRVRIAYDPTENIRAVVGFKDITLSDKNQDSKLLLDKIIIHPKYSPPEVIHHDLALVKLKKELTFHSKVMPICLPGGPKFPDNAGVVYAAGWGVTSEQYITCKTGKDGPAPYTRCKFPFKFGNLIWTNGCAQVSSPSSENESCKDLQRSLNGLKLPDKGYSRVK